MNEDSSNRDFELRLVKALIKLIYESRGKRVTIRAKLLLKIAGENIDQSSIVRVSMLLKRLVLKKLLKSEVRKRFQKSRSLNYVVHEGMFLWEIAKNNPSRAERLILEALSS